MHPAYDEAFDGFAAPAVPDSIATFLRDHWQKVLLVSWMEGGEQGTAWQENTAAIADLLWSIQPKPTSMIASVWPRSCRRCCRN